MYNGNTKVVFDSGIELFLCVVSAICFNVVKKVLIGIYVLFNFCHESGMVVQIVQCIQKWQLIPDKTTKVQSLSNLSKQPNLRMQTALEFSGAPFWFDKNLTIDSSSGLIFALFLELPYLAGYISLLLGKVFIDVNIFAL